MSLWEAVVVVLAGLAAGTINTVVGSGTLITFPTLLLLGIPPVSANISNSLGLCAAAVTSIPGFRPLLAGLGDLLRRFVPAAVLGAVAGAVLLLVLPAEAFRVIVPVLIALALVLVVLGPRINRWTRTAHQDAVSPRRLQLAIGAVALTSVYGGYFGAAQGIILVSLLSLLVPHPLPQVNALKVVLSNLTNLVAAVVFIAVARDQMRWDVAALIALGALGGGWLGSRIGTRISPSALRAAIVVVGVAAIVKLVAFP
ncbi:sulfite exporter TauE/SafE family protein [Arsenicicoccus sp. oral taxon 190]|uniref:sulfite exporter TauE/SafE family protein n=1 Tax=Arsenicicoccus sp. oral taxon 190 TaxID=1658671 RepID=UPI00067A2313|nr:sulfite exporter TauE/SafE family protein [Arsenicicoccus sp. oral taxon 190]AKT51952.1 membrane protein [Arsenicicoccus sp. oral taxon 190]